MRVIFSILLLLLTPAFVGVSVNATGVLESCHPDRVTAESLRVTDEKHFYTGHVERNATINAWLKTASRQEISKIWGDPFISKEDVLRWEIPSEISRHVSEEVSEINGAYCYYVSNRMYTIVVEEPRIKISDDERKITRVVKLGSSIFKRKE